jgi:hypothetical protein
MIPMVVVLVLFGLLMIFTGSSAVAPFIYTLFCADRYFCEAYDSRPVYIYTSRANSAIIPRYSRSFTDEKRHTS